MMTDHDQMAALGNLVDFEGIQSHGRSLFVWPGLLTVRGVDLLRQIAPWGVRIVSVTCDSACDIWPGEPRRWQLRVFIRPPGTLVTETALEQQIRPSEHHMVQTLHRICGITPLPRSVLAGAPGWHHALWRSSSAGRVCAVASTQLLAHPIGGLRTAPRLAAAVAVLAEYRGAGLGRRVVDDLFAQSPGCYGAALVERANRDAAAFFSATGWEDSGYEAEVLAWQ